MTTIYDTVIATADQGFKATVQGCCRYIRADGARCGVGHLLGDAVVGLENCSATARSLQWSEFAPQEYPVAHAALQQFATGSLVALQEAHDEAKEDDFVEDFLRRCLASEHIVLELTDEQLAHLRGRLRTVEADL